MKQNYFFACIAITMLMTLTGYSQKNLTFTVHNVLFEMIYVEGGAFEMGCTPNQVACKPDEKPIHSVTLSDYYIGELQMTQKLWDQDAPTTIWMFAVIISVLGWL